MLEILVSNSQPNNLERWFRRAMDAQYLREWFIAQINESRITPESHPLVMDLFTGDATIPAILAGLGWNPKQMCAADLYTSPEPMIEGVNWLYLDVYRLARAIKRAESLPPKIEILRHAFDLVTAFPGEDIKYDYLSIATGFFIKPTGTIIKNLGSI